MTGKDILRAAGLRATSERVSLYTQLAKAKKPVTAEELKAKTRNIDLATIYRNLDMFVERKLVEKLTLTNEHAHYEIAHMHHHHVVCETCKRIIPVHLCLPKGFLEKVEKASKVARITRHHLEFSGICKKCT